MDKIIKPWGYEKILYRVNGIQFKILHINQGEETSLQYHQDKVETLIPLDNNAVIEYGGEFINVPDDLEETNSRFKVNMTRGETYTINPRQIHRFIAATEDCELAELSNGVDSDIVRLEDKYNRKKEKL